MRKELVVALMAVSMSAVAASNWHDVSRSSTLHRSNIYCTSQKYLEEMGQYALDQDGQGATMMTIEGKCTVVQSTMHVRVFQETDDFANFIAPSGKAFYTLKGFLK